MKKPLRNVAASVRDRLLNLARATGQPNGELLDRYCIERLLYRLSRSEHQARAARTSTLSVTLLGKRPRFTDDERRRLASKAQKLGPDRTDDCFDIITEQPHKRMSAIFQTLRPPVSPRSPPRTGYYSLRPPAHFSVRRCCAINPKNE